MKKITNQVRAFVCVVIVGLSVSPLSAQNHVMKIWKEGIVTNLIPTSEVDSITFPLEDVTGLVGQWLFDDPENLGKATVGADIILVGTVDAAEGPSVTNGAAHTASGANNYLKALHGIAANGGGTKVNEYTVLIDFKKGYNGWHSFMNPDLTNTTTATLLLNGTNNFVSGDVLRTPNNSCVSNTWYRLVLTVKLGEVYDLYLNGNKIATGTVTGATGAVVDSKYALDPAGVLFGTDPSVFPELWFAQISMWNYSLSAQQILALGGVDN
jgi:hypothetical protein